LKNSNFHFQAAIPNRSLRAGGFSFFEQENSMQLIINGREEDSTARTIAELVHQKNLKTDRLVVEHNMNIVKQDRWSRVHLRDGDALELLSFVGGG
jgi:thiamine biosynthesis protein ThiS